MILLECYDVGRYFPSLAQRCSSSEYRLGVSTHHKVFLYLQLPVMTDMFEGIKKHFKREIIENFVFF